MAKRRVAVIGIDAADFAFLDPWMAAGHLPTLARLRKEGASGILRSTNPPVSSPAWATFMTGLNPGAHGLFDFVMEDPATQKPVIARSDYIKGARMWEVAAKAGLRCAVVNVPITWPVRPFDGLLVTGMLTPPGRPYTHPPELEAEIEAVVPGYPTDIDHREKEDRDGFRRHCDDVAVKNAKVMEHLLLKEPWDLFVGVFTTADRAKHFFWEERESVVLDHYRLLDRLIAKLLKVLGNDGTVMVISDHGFQSQGIQFYMNRWLREEGLLKVRRHEEHRPETSDRDMNQFTDQLIQPVRVKAGFLSRLLGNRYDDGYLEVDQARSEAYLYSVWTCGVKINVKGRDPLGIVEPGDAYEALRDRIIRGLGELRAPGAEKPFFDWVGRREEIYHGARLHWAPDVATYSRGYTVSASRTSLNKGRIFRESKHHLGTHSENGIFIAHGAGVKAGAALEPTDLQDVMPTVLWALGLPVPAGLDGRVLTEFFEPGTLAANPVREGEASPEDLSEATGETTPEEEAELRKTLEGLGYM